MTMEQVATERPQGRGLGNAAAVLGRRGGRG